MKGKITAGDEFRIKAIRHAIKRVGIYKNQVSVWIDKSSGFPIVYYKIDKTLAKNIFDKLRMSIELEANKLNFDISLQQ